MKGVIGLLLDGDKKRSCKAKSRLLTHVIQKIKTYYYILDLRSMFKDKDIEAAGTEELQATQKSMYHGNYAWTT